MTLTRAEARTIIEAAIAHAESLGQKASVAVLDHTGRVVSLDQMDGGKLHRDRLAMGKALCSVMLEQRTMDAKEIYESNPTRFYSLLAMFPGQIYLSFGGGVPFFADGRMVGAVGIAGGKTGDDDAMCDAGIAAWHAAYGHAP